MSAGAKSSDRNGHVIGDQHMPMMHELAPLLYNELRAMARGMMRTERAGHTLQPTAIVHEAYLRLAKQQHFACENRLHFLRLAGREMRRILVEYARAKRTAKRGRGANCLPLSQVTISTDSGHGDPVDILALDEAMTQLAEQDPEKVEIVELRFFAGLSEPEVAEVMNLPLRAVRRKWQVARSRLYNALRE